MIDENTQREIRRAVELYTEVESRVAGAFGQHAERNIERAAAIMQYLGAREHVTALHRMRHV
jgi:hypothetical protein